MRTSGSAGQRAPSDRRRRRRRRRHVRRVMLLALIVLLSPAIYSYATTMMRPSSLPVWPRSIEWLRAHHGNWLVDEVEHYYYSWKAPSKGGPQLTSLPRVGVGHAPRARAHRDPADYSPPRIASVFARPLRGEGVWRGTGP